MPSIASRLLKNTSWLYAKMSITMFISLYTTRLILNGLGASDFGIYNIVGGTIAMLGFLNAAMASASQRFMSYAEGEGLHEKKTVIFNVSILLHIIISLVIGCFLILGGYLFFDNIFNIPDNRTFAAKVVFSCLVLSTIISIMTVPYEAVINAHENMKYYAIVGIFESILKLIVAYICLISSKDKLVIYGILMSIIPVSILLILRTYCHKNYEECHLSIKKYYNKEVAKEMTNFAGWTFLSTATSMSTQYGMGLVINHFFGVIVNAAHGIATQLTGMLLAFTSNAQKAFNPILTKSEGAKDREKLIYLSLFGCRISYFIFGLFSLPIVFLMPRVLSLWLVDVPIWAVAFCRLSLLRILSEQLIISLVTALNAEGNIKQYCKYRSLSYILPIPILIFLFREGYPPYWLYIIWIFAWSIIGGAITIFYSKKSVGISFASYYKQVLFPCLLPTIISVIPYVYCIIQNCNTNIYYICAIVQIMLYFMFGICLILNNEERMKLRNTFIEITRLKTLIK